MCLDIICKMVEVTEMESGLQMIFITATFLFFMFLMCLDIVLAYFLFIFLTANDTVLQGFIQINALCFITNYTRMQATDFTISLK